jgi:O-antigen/teichoic acid export membrane protein
MPSVEALIVPAQFRGPFGHYIGLLLPGLFAMGFVSFGLNPAFQISKRTAPLIVAALAAVLVSLLLLFLLPWGADASNLAIAQAGGYLAALGVTVWFALREQPVWPSFWDLFAAAAATVVMAVAVAPLRSLAPGFFALVVQIGAGAAVYGLLVLVFDIAGLRSQVAAWLRPLIVRA